MIVASVADPEAEAKAEEEEWADTNTFPPKIVYQRHPTFAGVHFDFERSTFKGLRIMAERRFGLLYGTVDAAGYITVRTRRDAAGTSSVLCRHPT